MTGALTLGFRLATEAVRGRGGLRDATAGLQAAARCCRGLRSAGARFPGSVAGDDLLALMGAQFRELQKGAAAQPGGSVAQQGAREFAGGTHGYESRTWERAAAVPGQDRAAAVAGKTEPAATRFPALPDGAGGKSHAADAPRSQTTNPTPDWPLEAAAHGAATPWPDGPPPSRRRRLPASTTTLAKILARYWEIDRRARSKGPAASVPADALRRTRPLSPAESPAGSPPPRDRQHDVRQAEFARRLEAFMSRSPQIVGGQHRFAQQSMPPPDRPALYQDLAPRLGDGELAGDFAEKLADTLREQAIQHGIDIT